MSDSVGIRTGSELATLLSGYRFTFKDEAGLQESIAAALETSGCAVEREVRLDAHSRIDILVGRVGIEVKVKGSPTEVTRQLQRYAHSDLVDEIVLVTHRSAHGGFLPNEIGTKPVHVAWIGGSL